MGELPTILRAVRLKLAKEGHAAQFNRVRASVQAFVRDTLGQNGEITKALATSLRWKKRRPERTTLSSSPLVLGARFTGAKDPTGRGAKWQARLFADAIRKASGGKVQPYDLRRTYATWMEAAQISRTRRRQYMGHSTKDVTDLYEAHEVERYLIEDGAKLEAWVRDRERETLTIKGAASS